MSIGQTIDDLELSDDEPFYRCGRRLARILESSVLIVFDEKGVVRQVSALNGYLGKLFGKFRVGMPIRAVIDDKSWTFAEWHDGFVNRDAPGVVIEASIEDADKAEIFARADSLLVESITVYTP